MPRRAGGGSDALVVLASELAPIIEEWIKRWEAERPTDYTMAVTRRNTAGEGFVGPVAWLEQETDISARTILAIRKLERKTVSLRIADTILTAIGENYRLELDVRVIPNPMWTQETWNSYMAERGCIEDISD